MITGALIGFAVWFGIVMFCTVCVVALGRPAPRIELTGIVKAVGFALVGALIGHLVA
ncbi:hypothetical protein [Sphingomonas sp.]|uniref:hypothetical protein n=1 Tax=Sphingomonas sp. TaxID=28214 RepID=UPI002ED7F085